MGLLGRIKAKFIKLAGPFSGNLSGKTNVEEMAVVVDNLSGTGGGIAHAASDGNHYASKNGSWDKVSNGFQRIFNVQAYGATGNGSTDDTSAIQAAVNAAVLAGGTVYFPSPSNFYRINNTILVRPQSGQSDQRPVNFLGEGDWHMIEFYSTTGRACFEFRGIKRMHAEGLNIYLKSDDQIAFDVVMDATYQSQSHFKFTKCSVSLSGKCSTGWRLTTEGGFSDTSVFHFDTCDVASSDGRASIGWLDTNSNGLAYVWNNCGGSHLHSFYNNAGREASLSAAITNAVTTIPVNNPEMFPQRGGRIKINDEFIDFTSVSGSNLVGCTRGVNSSTPASHGSGSTCRIDTWQGGGGEGKTFISTVTSFNEHDFYFGSAGTYSVYGGRFEVGKKFARFGTWSTAHTIFNLNGATMTQYGGGTGADAGVVFHIGGPVKLNIDGCVISQVDYTANMIKDMANVDLQWRGPGGSLAIRNTMIQNTTGVTQFWTLQSDYLVLLENVMIANGAAQGLAVLNTQGIADAPSDSKKYARQNAAWVEVLDLTTHTHDLDDINQGNFTNHFFPMWYNTGWVEAELTAGANISLTKLDTGYRISAASIANIVDANDVDADIPITDGSFLRWNNTTSKWTKHILNSADIPSHQHSATDIFTGTLPTARGGTGQTAWTANRLVYSSSSTVLSSLNAITANRALVSNASGLPEASAVTNTELAYLSGTNSPIQTQLNGKANAAHTHNVADILQSTYTNNDIIMWYGTGWIKGRLYSNGGNISVTATSEGYAFSATTEDRTLVGLDDVDADNPSNGDIVRYNTDAALNKFQKYNLDAALDTKLNKITTVSTKTANYTLASGDNQFVIEFSSSSALTLTIPSGLPVGMTVSVVRYGSGEVSITPGASVTLFSESTKRRIATQYSAATLYHRGSNVWVLFGAIKV